MYNDFLKILNSSKTYEMDCNGCLTVSDYYTGKSFTIDLTMIPEDLFEEMLVVDEEYEDDEDDEF